MKPFKNISPKENEDLLKFPAYISLLAASRNDKLDEVEKKTAIKFAHTKTFTSDSLLTDFYKEADKVFEKNIEQIDKELPTDKLERETTIKKELLGLEEIVSKLGGVYPSVMHNSMESFKQHVSKAHHNVLEDFFFPIPIPGLTQ